MDATERLPTLVILALAAVLAAGIAFFVAGHRSEPAPLELVADTPRTGEPIEVYITGAVARPGVYQLSYGDRAVDALYAAGGQTPDADLEAINLATRLRDEEQIVVPRVGAAPSGTSQVAGAATGPANINTASAAELDALPGIGEVYSARIVESRERDGPFQSLEDLLARDLIPRATFEKIYGLITLGP